MSHSTWAPSPEQRARLLAFEAWLLALCQQLEAQRLMHDFERAVASRRRALQRGEPWQARADMPAMLLTPLDQHEFGAQLCQHVADYYFFPAEVQYLPNARARTSNLRDRADVITELCQYFLLQLPCEYAFELGIARLAYQINNPSSDIEINIPEWMAAEKKRIKKDLHPMIAKEELSQLTSAQARYKHPFLAPACDDLLELLLNLATDAARLQRLYALVNQSQPILPAITRCALPAAACAPTYWAPH